MRHGYAQRYHRWAEKAGKTGAPIGAKKETCDACGEIEGLLVAPQWARATIRRVRPTAAATSLDLAWPVRNRYLRRRRQGDRNPGHAEGRRARVTQENVVLASLVIRSTLRATASTPPRQSVASRFPHPIPHRVQGSSIRARRSLQLDGRERSHRRARSAVNPIRVPFHPARSPARQRLRSPRSDRNPRFSFRRGP